jgi:hypothetical protein
LKFIIASRLRLKAMKRCLKRQRLNNTEKVKAIKDLRFAGNGG